MYEDEVRLLKLKKERKFLDDILKRVSEKNISETGIFKGILQESRIEYSRWRRNRISSRINNIEIFIEDSNPAKY